MQNTLEAIENEIKQLEMSDDRLMTNGNGNLSRYQHLQAEAARLRCTITQTPAVLLHRHEPWDRVAILCITNGRTFESLTEAAKAIGVSKSTLSNHLAGRSPHVRGLKFVRVTPVE